jgi:hypothetical protein
MNWIKRVTDSYQDNEAPERFFYWAALCALSAIARKKVYLDKFQYKLYPNIFAFLIAGSGGRKGLPVWVARKLVEKAHCTRVIYGRASIQRIIQELGKPYPLGDGVTLRDAQGFLVSGELAAFLVKDPDALTILTDIYDTHSYEDFWINSLKSTDTDKLRSPCLTLLGATNEDHFAEAVPNSAVGGGFIARTFIVLSNEKCVPNSLTDPPENTADIESLSEYLMEIATLEGEFKWTDKGKKLYNEWYYPHISKSYFDPTGTMKRLGDQVLKVAMLVSLSEGPSLELDEQCIFEAITVSEACVLGMQQVTMGSGKHAMTAGTRIVVRELVLNPMHQVDKAILLQRYIGQFDDFDLTRIAETLQAANVIDIIPHGKEMVYKMKASALAVYQDFKKAVQ